MCTFLCLHKVYIKFILQELKIRKPGARGRRRSKREAGNGTLEEEDQIFEEELMEETPPPGDYIEDGEGTQEFGFVGRKNYKNYTKNRILTNQRFTEIEVGDDRERRSALLDWDGDYSQFQRDEVGKPFLLL